MNTEERMALAIAAIIGGHVEVEDKHAQIAAIVEEGLPKELDEPNRTELANELATWALEGYATRAGEGTN